MLAKKLKIHRNIKIEGNSKPVIKRSLSENIVPWNIHVRSKKTILAEASGNQNEARKGSPSGSSTHGSELRCRTEGWHQIGRMTSQ